MTWKRVAAVLAVGAALTLTAATAAADTGAIFVDDDREDCPQAEAQSIQQGVLLADPGDTVHVCPGSYEETVQVDRPVRLDGAGPDPHVRVGDPESEAVVTPSGGFGFILRAPGVVLDGFTVRSANVGVRTDRASVGFRIQKNLFVLNVTGLELASSGGALSVVRENAFRSNRRFAIFNNLRSGPVRDTQITVNDFDRDETAISALGDVSGTVIDNNTFFGHRLGGIVLTGTTNVVTHNRLENVTRPIRVSGFQRNVVSYNDVRNSRLPGIEFLGGASAVVEYNHVFRTNGDGISLQAFIRGTVRGNHLEENGRNGLHFWNDSRSNLVEVNKGFANAQDGIRFDERSALNRIENNLFDENLEHDCHDDTLGPLPGGTRNFWGHNLGDTANRPEICQPTGRPAAAAPPEPFAALSAEWEPPCMPYTAARETEVSSEAWDGVEGVCSPTMEELGPPPEDG
jgi:parallel beta-helix repeat protein